MTLTTDQFRITYEWPKLLSTNETIQRTDSCLVALLKLSEVGTDHFQEVTRQATPFTSMNLFQIPGHGETRLYFYRVRLSLSTHVIIVPTTTARHFAMRV